MWQVFFFFPVNCFSIKARELNHVGGGSTGITEITESILGNIVILVVVILPINETTKFTHLFVSSSMVLKSGLKLGSVLCRNEYYWR